MIPRYIHQIWLGDHDPHPLMEEWTRKWKKLNPDWAVFRWCEEGPGSLVVKGQQQQPCCKREVRATSEVLDLLGRACNLAQKANIWRYCLLYCYGGLYVDTDVEPLRPVDRLASLDAFTVARRQASVMYENGFMGCSPGHPWMRDLVRGLPSHDPTVPLSMGCTYMTDVTRRSHPEVTLVSSDDVVFDPPVDWEAAKREGRAPTPESARVQHPDAVAVHHWASLWYPTGFKEIRRAVT